MIAAAITAMTRIKTPESLPIQASQADLQPVIMHMKLNGIIGQLITHLKGLQTLKPQLSPPMPLGTPTIPYMMMGPQMLSKFMPSNIVKNICILDSDANRIVFNNYSWIEIPSTYKHHNSWNQWKYQSIYSNQNWKFTHSNLP